MIYAAYTALILLLVIIGLLTFMIYLMKLFLEETKELVEAFKTWPAYEDYKTEQIQKSVKMRNIQTLTVAQMKSRSKQQEYNDETKQFLERIINV